MPFREPAGTGVLSPDVHRLLHRELPRRPRASGALSRLDAVDELRDLLVDVAPLGHLVGDLLDRVHDRRVVPPAELPGDLGVAVIRQLPEDVHADLARADQRSPAAPAAEAFARP